MNRKNGELNFFGVALMFVGTIMGAGFASGREIWQFFGVFGNKGYFGVLFVGILFVFFGFIASKITRTLKTMNLGSVIAPGGNKGSVEFIGYLMAFMLFTVMITMTSAGGALFSQQFGLSKVLGGIFIVVLVIATVLGDFERVSKVFRYIMPTLVVLMVVTAIMIIISPMPDSGYRDVPTPSKISPFWYTSAFLYITFNMFSVLPISIIASYNAKSDKDAYVGMILGGLFIGVLAFIIATATMKEPSFSQAMEMPMLAYSARLSKTVNFMFTGVLMLAIYSSATSNFYGFTTKLREGKHKNAIIIVAACLGFLIGLIGFSNVIAYMFPLEGILGIAIAAMLIKNYIKVVIKGERIEMTEMTENKLENISNDASFENFENHDRLEFPEGLKRVTAGKGGDAVMVFGSEKTALMDCGMAYCGNNLVKNIDIALKKNGKKTLDYVFLSHTHYDHVGALPYVIEKWPDVIVYGAEKAKHVFRRPGAIAVMKELGETARDLYGDSNEEIKTEGFRIDRILKDWDEVSLGETYIKALETKGHTDCSMTYILEPEKIMFASESTGVIKSPTCMRTAILKSYSDSIESYKKCKNYGAKQIVSPHYGIVPKYFTDEYFEIFLKQAEEERDFVRNFHNQGMSEDEILKVYEEKYWMDDERHEQPKDAFLLNSKITIKTLLKEFI